MMTVTNNQRVIPTHKRHINIAHIVNIYWC